MQHHETIVAVVLFADEPRQFNPVFRFHVARVDGRIKRLRVDFIVEAVELRHVMLEVLQIEVFQSTRFGILYHADSASRINNENGQSVHIAKLRILPCLAMQSR